MATDARKAAERAEIERARTWLWSQREPMKCVNCGEVKENWRFQVMCTQAAIQYHTCPKSNSGHVYEFKLDPDATEKMLAAYESEVRVQTLEDAAKRCEATIGSLAVSRDRASAAGRDCVSACRQSDIETLERAGAAIRAMKGE